MKVAFGKIIYEQYIFEIKSNLPELTKYLKFVHKEKVSTTVSNCGLEVLPYDKMSAELLHQWLGA